MKIGYVYPHRRFKVPTQIKSLIASGVEEKRIFVEGRDGETLEHVMNGCDPGDVVCVMWLFILAQPGRKGMGRPRSRLRKTVSEIIAQGGCVLECETGRILKKCNDEHAMMLDAIDQLADDGRHPKKVKRPGRRTVEETLDAAVLEKGKRIWESRRNTLAEAIAKLRELGLTKTFAYSRWGKRGMK